MINLNHFQGMNKQQLAAKYVQVRTATLATEYGAKFARVDILGKLGVTTAEAAFDSHVSYFVQPGAIGIRHERDRLLAAFGQLHGAYTRNVSIPPSQETLAWGGFLGGEILHDTSDADATCLRVLREAA